MRKHSKTQRAVCVLASAVVIGAFSLVMVHRVSAYALLGPRWNVSPSSGCCATLYSYVSSISGFGDSNDWYAWLNAYDSWTHTSHSASNINWITSSASILCNASDTYNSGVSWDGITNWSSSGGHFTSALASLNYYYTAGYAWQDRQGVAAHEAGHQVGIDHVSGCHLMVADTPTRSSCGIFQPTTDDFNGVNALY